MITEQDKLDYIENLIPAARKIRGPDSDSVALLSAIAKDIRARLNAAPCVALVQLQRRIDDRAASLANKNVDHRIATSVSVAEELIGRWPVVKQALERFGAEVDAERTQGPARDS